MKNYILIYLLTFISFALYGQSNNDTWFAFRNHDSTLIGFKDKNGIVKIKPKFTSFISANKFDNIIAVTEDHNRKLNSYYLTKSGKIAGKSSLYIFDNTADCESEGFIRFMDKHTHKVGLLNSKGNIVVPAKYNALSRVQKGMIVALKGAYWDKNKISEDNPYPWIGGKEVLIDTNNKILIEGSSFNSEIDFFSLHISALPDKNPIRENYKAVNGRYYSFVNFEKEFKAWLKSSLLANLSKNNLLSASAKKIAFWKQSAGWIDEETNNFINRNFGLIKSKLTELKSANCKYDIFSEDLNPYIYSSSEYEKYFNNCGESKSWIYPVKNIVITHIDNNKLSQDQLGFLRTVNGYKLVSVSINKGEIK